MMKKIILLPAFIFFLMTTRAFAQQPDETVFKQRLEQYLTSQKSKVGLQESQSRLWKFAEDYPNSKYADDARYVILWFNSGKNIDLAKWKAFSERFPDGKLEASTIDILKETVPGTNNPFTLSEWRLPYNAALLNAKSMDALMRNDYQGVIRYSSELIKLISQDKANFSESITFNYVKILTSYKHLNNRAEFERVKQEAINLLPDKKERFEEFWR